MSTAEAHTYTQTELPLVQVEHFKFAAHKMWVCVQEDCDGEHHYYVVHEE